MEVEGVEVGVESNPFRRAIEAADGGKNWRQFRPGEAEGESWTRGKLGCGLVLIALSDLTSEVTNLLYDIVGEQFPTRVYSEYGQGFGGFNDHSDTTWDDVRTVFEKAAVKWDERI